jgi:hypothetical protein
MNSLPRLLVQECLVTVFNSFLFMQCGGIHLSEVVPSASQDAINLISVSISIQ